VSSKKKRKGHKPHHKTLPPVDLRGRVEKARREGRSQQALELAKQLHKQDPSPANRELLREVYLLRAQQLAGQNHTRDAISVLEVALHLEEPDGQPTAWLERVAGELARCGAPARALALLGRLPEEVTARVRCQAVDAAVEKEAAGRATLPPELHPEFDGILQAFQQLEQGQDEGVRQSLQGIGLRSPFLEWKVLLRGLQAYYQNDDERALENWRRLDPGRLPARLAAPFRFRIDSEFAQAQSPATQSALQRQADLFEGGALATSLRELRRALENRESLASAFRMADNLLPTLRVQASQLVPRLASCFYWAVLEVGPDEILRYQRVFGPPPDDPHFTRLRALAMERNGMLPTAQLAWQQYEEEIRQHPQHWPGEQAKRARALIWLHMGKNAVHFADVSETLTPPFGFGPLTPPTMEPSAEHCFQQSLELAPDLPEPYEALFDHLLDEGKEARAEKVARRMLKRFPDHSEMLTRLADRCLEKHNHQEALELLRRALVHNPLDRRLRNRINEVHFALSADHLQAGRFDEALEQCRLAQEMGETGDVPMLVCRRAAVAFKAGDEARGEELIQEALSRAIAPLEVSHLMLIEVMRFKLHRSLKTRFDREFNRGLAGPLDGACAAALAHTVAALHKNRITYYGQKTHDKKVMGYLDRVLAIAEREWRASGHRRAPDPSTRVDLTEKQMEVICDALVTLGSKKVARQFCQLGQARFPKNPYFYYFEARTYLDRAFEGGTTDWTLRQLLERAQQLARAIPPDDRQQQMLAEIEEYLEEIHQANPFGRMFGSFGSFGPFGPLGPLGPLFGGEDDFDDEDDDPSSFF
jgi:tetratricopeptide (TPR) repeat protein